MGTERDSGQPKNHHAIRAGNGRFSENPITSDLDAEACRLRSRSLTYREIAEIMGCDESVAWDRVKRGLAAARERRAEAGADLVALELMKLDRLEQHALRVLESFHYMVNEGRVVQHRVVNPDTGRREYRPLEDQGPVLAAVKALNDLSKSRRVLLGADAPKAMELSGGVTYRFENVSGDDL